MDTVGKNFNFLPKRILEEKEKEKCVNKSDHENIFEKGLQLGEKNQLIFHELLSRNFFKLEPMICFHPCLKFSFDKSGSGGKVSNPS